LSQELLHCASPVGTPAGGASVGQGRSLTAARRPRSSATPP
jgi:hypothetical protein